MQTRARDNAGMTLVELMIVVVIIGILAAVATVGYRKYVGRARLSEATAILAEFALKEQLYFLDSGQYAPARADGRTFASTEQPDVSAGAFWPHDPTVTWDSARQAFPVDPLPQQWRRLGIRPRWKQLFCTYMVNGGPPATWTGFGAGGTETFTANVPWFYAIATCNLVGQAQWPAVGSLTVMILTHETPQIQTLDERH